jgi:hypothetical protein
MLLSGGRGGSGGLGLGGLGRLDWPVFLLFSQLLFHLLCHQFCPWWLGVSTRLSLDPALCPALQLPPSLLRVSVCVRGLLAREREDPLGPVFLCWLSRGGDVPPIPMIIREESGIILKLSLSPGAFSNHRF